MKFLMPFFLVCSAAVWAGDAGVLVDAGAGPGTAPPHITVQAAPAPNVTVQAAPAPNVTVQAAPAPNVTVQAAPTPNVNVQPATVNVPAAQVTVQPPKTDWNALWTQLGAAFGTIAAAVAMLARAIRNHRQAGTAESDWQDMLAYAYQFAKGDGLARIRDALEVARRRFRESSGGDMTRADEMDAEHGLAALHLQAVGAIQHDPAEELNKEEAALKNRLAVIQAAKGATVPALVLCALLFCGGCTVTTKGDQLRQDIASSAASGQVVYKNLVDTFIAYYVSNENARIDAIHAAAVASHDAPTAAKIAALQKSVKLQDGSTILTGDPVAMAAVLDGKAKIVAALTQQRQANYDQVQRVATGMREKLLAAGADLDHIVALTEGLKTYFATRTNVEATINASADEVLKLATQFIPAPKAKPAKK